MGEVIARYFHQLHILTVWTVKRMRHARSLPTLDTRVRKGRVDDEEDAESQYVQTNRSFFLLYDIILKPCKKAKSLIFPSSYRHKPAAGSAGRAENWPWISTVDIMSRRTLIGRSSQCGMYLLYLEQNTNIKTSKIYIH